jgi:RNA polymerase sigma factor (sigma-70 family)
MADRGLQSVLQHTRKLVSAELVGGLSDHELLERFVRSRDEVAFTALVERHLPMVLGVCRRILGQPQDAEDASQATFLVLARTAASIRKRTSLGSWLHGVAYRLCRRIRRAETRRRIREARAGGATPANPTQEASWREVQAALDEELTSLPEKFQAPLVLCYLEGRTRDEAAEQLGVKLSTLRGRLEQGRDRLRTRLARRGVTLSAALLVPALVEAAGAGFGSPSLLITMVHAALGPAAPVEAARATLWAQGVIKAMTPSKLKLALAACLLLGLGAGGGLIAHQIGATGQDEPSQAKAEDPPAPAEALKPGHDCFGDPLPPGAVARLGTLRFRPGAYVSSLAFTPDGRQLVSHGPFTGIHVWDAATGKELQSHVAANNDWLGAALLTPDGQSIVTVERADQKQLIRIRSRADLNVSREFPVGYLQSARLTPDGKLLVGLGSNGKGNDTTVEVWDLAQGKQLRSWQAHADYAWCFDLGRDGKTLVTGGQDSLIRVWDITTGRLIRELTGNPNVLSKVAVSPDGKRVASIGMTKVDVGGGASVFPSDNRVRIWDVPAGTELRQLHMDARGELTHGYPPGFCLVTFSDDGRTLITCGLDGVLRFWDPDTGKEHRQCSFGRVGVVALAVAPDSQTIAIGGRSIQLFDAATGKEKLPQLGRLSSTFASVFTPDGRTIATGGEGQVQLWDAHTGKLRGRLEGHDQAVRGLYLSADGNTLVSMGMDKSVRVWDLAMGKERHRLDVPNTALTALALAPDGATVAVAHKDKSVRLVEFATGKERQRLEVNAEYGGGAAFSPNGRTLVVWCSDHTAQVWDLASGKMTRQFEFAEGPRAANMPVAPGFGDRGRMAYTATVSPDGRLIAYGSQQGYLAVHEVATGKVVRLVDGLNPDGAGVLTFSADGRMLARAGWRQATIHLLELATGKERVRFTGHKGRIMSLAFAADGHTLASTSEDTTALVWDVAGSSGDDVLDVDAAWRDLADADTAKAFNVMRRLCASPKSAAALLHERITPTPIPDAKKLAKAIADLDSNNFEERDAAVQHLEKVGEAALAACRAALKGNVSLELRRRLEGFAEKYAVEKWNPGPQRLRMLRALEVLEMAGTAEARAELKRLAGGAPGSQLTEEANASLARLAKRPQ